MKKIFNNNVLITVFCCFLCFYCGVKAVSTYHSYEIQYTSTDSSWNVKNVQAAVDDLSKLRTDLTNIKSIGNADASYILTGYNALVKGITTAGTMSNYSGTTKTASTVTESGSNALITIPSSGYYNTSSKISVPISTIKNYVTALQSGVYYLGTGNRFDLTTVCNNNGINCSSLTSSNFIVGLSTIPNSSKVGQWQSDDSDVFVNLYGCTVSKNYDASSHILTVAGTSVSATGGSKGGYVLLPPEVYDNYNSYEDFYKEWGWLEDYDYEVPGDLYDDGKTSYTISTSTTSSGTVFAYLVVGTIK